MAHRIWLTDPADDWLEAFPLGNGTLGAMVFGGRRQETILLNHEWLYRAKYRYREQEIKSQYIEKIQKLFLEEDGRSFLGDRIHLAGSFANEALGGEGGVLEHLMGKKNRVDPYQPVGYLTIGYDNVDLESGLRRELNLRDGIATVERNTIDGGSLLQETFAHFSRTTLITRITSGSGTPIGCTVALSREKDPDCGLRFRRGPDCLGFIGSFDEGVLFSTEIRVAALDGLISANGPQASDGLRISGAREILIVCTIATSNDTTYPMDVTRWTLSDTPFDWQILSETHLAEHRALYDRVDIDLGTGDESAPTDERLRALRDGAKDEALLAYEHKIRLG